MADAFDKILSAKADEGAQALESLVEQLNNDKEKTIHDALKNPGSEDVLWAVLSMLSSKITRMASNSAYVIGSLAETEEGSKRIFSILKGSGRKTLNALEDLTHMLEVEDAETVMNAAGTLGTLAETEEGRAWMLEQACADAMITNTTFLLGSENHWTASNSALVLARLTISELGRKSLLDHSRSSYILQRIVQSLGNDSAGRGMNAAFAIGRLLDTKSGKERLLNGSDTEKMITSLCRMMAKGDMGGAKNACFAISCLAADADGNQLILVNNYFQDAINRLVSLLRDEDTEACWFSAMTLKTISSHKLGVLRLRQNANIEASLLKVLDRPHVSKELNDEVTAALANLKKLDRPDPPYVEVLGSRTVKAIWNRVSSISGFQVTYKLACDNKVVYKGQDAEYVVSDLQPFTAYSIKLRTSTTGDDSTYSETVTVTTDEDVPTAPTFLRVMGCTPTQLRLTWNMPEHCNGIFRGYYLYIGEKLLECTQDASYIIGRLTPSTKYTVSVCASTAKGMGDRAVIEATTEELGAHAPEKPTVTVIGRNEMQVSWNPPSVPLGRFFRYELCVNDTVAYHGIDKFHRATGLTPDTDYVFVVVAITSEGRCASDPTKRRTHKDKSQTEPGHHKLKTHSFKAKEFQAMQERAKTQAALIPPIQKPKHKLKKRNSTVTRPSSNYSISNASDTSVVTDGTWGVGANELNEQVNSENIAYLETRKNTRKAFRNPAVIGGAPVKNLHYTPTTSATARSEVHGSTGEFHKDSTFEGQLTAAVDPENNLPGTNAISYASADSAKKKPDSAVLGASQHGVENRKQQKSSTLNRMKYRRGHAIANRKKVLKPDKELLAEKENRSSNQKYSDPNLKLLPKTGYGQRTTRYYPDIVSTIRKRHEREGQVEEDLINGHSRTKISADSPDSLDPEPGTARNDVDSNCEFLGKKLESVPLRYDLLHERNFDAKYTRSWTSSARSSGLSNAASKSSHVIVKPAAHSKYGLKYNIQGHVASSSLSSIEADSAFHSSSNMRDSLEELRGNFLGAAHSDHSGTGRTLPSRLKSPASGYWSEYDIAQSRGLKKPAPLAAINYRKFQSAHRPTKSIRLESSAVSNLENGQLFSSENELGKYRFISAHRRTQHANLSGHLKSGQSAYRLESLQDHSKKTKIPEPRAVSNTHSHNTQAIATRPANQPDLRGQSRLRKITASHPTREDIATSVLSLKTGSILAALNYHSGYNPLMSDDIGYSRCLPKATSTSVPHTVLSPLSPSEDSASSNARSSSKFSKQSFKSPRLRLTTSSTASPRSPIPTAGGYAITPNHSLSPLSNDGRLSHITKHLALIPGGGDPV